MLVTMSEKELSRINIIQSVSEKRLRRRDAAITGISACSCCLSCCKKQGADLHERSAPYNLHQNRVIIFGQIAE